MKWGDYESISKEGGYGTTDIIASIQKAHKRDMPQSSIGTNNSTTGNVPNNTHSMPTDKITLDPIDEMVLITNSHMFDVFLKSSQVDKILDQLEFASTCLTEEASFISQSRKSSLEIFLKNSISTLLNNKLESLTGSELARVYDFMHQIDNSKPAIES